MVKTLSLSAGREWIGQTSGLLVVQLFKGSAYWLEGLNRIELTAGSMLFVSGRTPGRILASQLTEVPPAAPA